MASRQLLLAKLPLVNLQQLKAQTCGFLPRLILGPRPQAPRGASSSRSAALAGLLRGVDVSAGMGAARW